MMSTSRVGMSERVDPLAPRRRDHLHRDIFDDHYPVASPGGTRRPLGRLWRRYDARRSCHFAAGGPDAAVGVDFERDERPYTLYTLARTHRVLVERRVDAVVPRRAVQRWLL